MIAWAHVVGHRQVTDAYLLALAKTHGGKLATFDRGVAALLPAAKEQQTLLYFPAGTYVVSKTLTWPKQWNGKDNWGKTFLCGQHRDKSIIRLKDATFTDAQQAQAIMWCGGFGSADGFHNYVENLTFDVGAQNPGAIALQFYSNNSGAVRDCRFTAGEGSGVVGLDLAHRDMNGPLLVRHCEVIGFQTGIASARAVNSQTFEHITLRGQSRVGFKNEGQAISIRGLTIRTTPSCEPLTRGPCVGRKGP